MSNQFAQYELCFGNKFHVKPNGYNAIKSTGFRIAGESSVVYLTDTPNIQCKGGPVESVTNTAEASNVFRTRPQNVTATTGILSIVKVGENGEKFVVAKDAGTVDYKKGEIILNTVNIVDTVVLQKILLRFKRSQNRMMLLDSKTYI